MFSREWYLEQWQKCAYRNQACQIQGEQEAKTVLFYKTDFYDPASAISGVPWYLIGCLDCREESFQHSRYLGNGDPLDKPTIHVPKGRGPFATWADGAADALSLNYWDKLSLPETHWDLVTALMKAELWNGMGYAERGLPSPYVWAGTNIQKTGKYVSDGVWDASVWDLQPGVAQILFTLKNKYGVDVGDN